MWIRIVDCVASLKLMQSTTNIQSWVTTRLLDNKECTYFYRGLQITSGYTIKHMQLIYGALLILFFRTHIITHSWVICKCIQWLVWMVINKLCTYVIAGELRQPSVACLHYADMSATMSAIICSCLAMLGLVEVINCGGDWSARGPGRLCGGARNHCISRLENSIISWWANATTRVDSVVARGGYLNVGGQS